VDRHPIILNWQHSDTEPLRATRQKGGFALDSEALVGQSAGRSTPIWGNSLNSCLIDGKCWLHYASLKQCGSKPVSSRSRPINYWLRWLWTDALRD